MVDRLVAVDDADYRLPEPVQQALATDLEDAASVVGAAVDATIDLARGKEVVVANHPRFGTPYTKSALLSAIDYAETLGRGTVLYCPAGSYDVGAGLSLAGKTVQIKGDGAYVTDGGVVPHSGTIFYASTQTGPVLDFTGWLDPWNFQGRVTHEGFMVRGSGVADPTKNNAGIRVKELGSTTFRDIAILGTGGPGIEGVESAGNAQYLSDFERITITTPVGAVANDVPYMYFNESNCNRFRGIGFRAFGTAANVGISGALVIASPPAFGSALSLYDGLWFENLRVPSGGALVRVSSRKNTFSDFQFIDCFKETGATGTAFFRFVDAPGSLQGGNEVRGQIPGRDPDYPDSNPNLGYHSIDYGVDLQQAFNRVVGVKGRNGFNVKIATGKAAHVELGGSLGSAASAAVVQEGTASVNTVIVDGGGGARTSSGWESVGTNGVIVPLSNLSASFTMTTANNVVTYNGVDLTATLPDPTTVARGREFVVKNLHATALTVVSAGTAKVIDGASSKSLAQYESLRVMSNGTMWIKV